MDDNDNITFGGDTPEEDYDPAAHLVALREVIEAEQGLISLCEKDELDLEARLAVERIHLDSLRQNLAFLKNEAPVVVLYGSGNQRGRYISLLEDISIAEAEIANSERQLKQRIADRKQAQQDLIRDQQEFSYLERDVPTFGRLIDAAHRFKRHG